MRVSVEWIAQLLLLAVLTIVLVMAVVTKAAAVVKNNGRVRIVVSMWPHAPMIVLGRAPVLRGSASATTSTKV